MTSETIVSAVHCGLHDPDLAPAVRAQLTRMLLESLALSAAAAHEIADGTRLDDDSAWWFRATMKGPAQTWANAERWSKFLDKVESQVAARRLGLDPVIKAARNRAAPPVETVGYSGHFSPSQKAVWQELREMGDVFFAGRWHNAGIKPRITPLITGTSGCGKSHLVRAFALSRGLPLLRLSFGEWIARGARAQPDTATRIHRFLRENPRCAIFIDEIDKVGRKAESDWGASIQNELFMLLDRTYYHSPFSDDPAVDAQVRDALSHGAFLIVAGTWQDAWESYERTLGFGKAQAPDPVSDIQAARKIPDELLRRFGGKPLVLPAPSASELEELARAEGLHRMAEAAGWSMDYRAGETSRRGIRWLEDQRLEVERLLVQGLVEDDSATSNH